jgi:hypothetical protein
MVAKGLLKEVIDDLRADQELSWQESQPADSRFNWRVTVHHGDYFIHVMAVDKNFERFAFSLQTEGGFDEGLRSDSPRPSCYQYKLVNRLSELKPIFDDLYGSFKRQEEERRQQDRKRLADEETKRQQEKRQTLLKIKAFVAFTSWLVLLFVIMENSPLEGWKFWLGILVGVPFSLWVLKAMLDPSTERDRERNRADEERIQRQAKAREESRIYNENYRREERALRNRVLADLKAVARGDKRRLDPEAVEAVKKIMERQGLNDPRLAEDPEVKAWTALIDDLSAETLQDAKAIQDRLADLLYPETLEDVEALKKLQSEGIEKISRGGHPSPENLEAAAALREIWARKERRQREEEEAEALERRQEKEREREQAKIMDEMMKRDVRSLAHLYGLSEDALRVLEDMPLHEVTMYFRFLRHSHKFAHLPPEEREKRAFEELERELEQERQERRKRTER